MATGWRLAKSLEKLRSQVNSAYPNRSKASDGTIGDASHAASASDHNPNKNGVVCALDLTNDPANGFDVHALAEHLRVNRHPNLRYIISNARVAGWWTNWEWQPSSGHTQHAHFSVGTLGVGDGKTYDRYDDETKWDIKESNMSKATAEDVKYLYDSILGETGWTLESVKSTGYVGQEYESVVKDMSKFVFDRGLNFGNVLKIKNDEISELRKALEEKDDRESAKKLQAIKDALR